MTKTMLIDAAHAEETRVAVVDGNRIEELDFEIASRRQLRGNIYLAKVVRVEPSLQAAFIEYGGNRHGFLAFNEIHPDYFQIPVADREALMREVADDSHHEDDEPEAGEEGEDGETKPVAVTPDDDDDMEAELERRRRRLMRRYKIQEVIRRRQIMLVQVVKEERGNKGAALTTYMSLAGRYCVLMPNTARGGGISRKITNASDRKRLKSAVGSLDVPAGIGLIVRTAGAARTKVEIKRDYDYLLRLWENIRETTMKSIAPAQIYAEEDLVKRAIRDMYDKDIDSIQVEGEAGYREARDFMRMIMPSQAKKVVRYAEPTPLFVRHRLEDQLAQIHSPIVQLKSGGYLVINQTEALVAIDVNSGRATRERNIETTAFKTNMEAAEEASRQLRLRDLAGLIVIDFIDMDEGKNNRAVEKKLKDCLKDDRARVQMGKISVFGLMEISRQRRRMGVLEGATNVCTTCQGVGRVRSVESSALSALRALDMEGSRGAGCAILRLPTEVALYVLNSKRGFLSRLEDVHGLEVTIATDDHLAAGEHAIERTEHREGPPRAEGALARLPAPDPQDLADETVEDDADEDEIVSEGDVEERAPREPRQEARSEGDDADGRPRGRRRRRRGGRGREEGAEREPREPREAAAEGDAAEGEAAFEGEDRAPAGETAEEGEARRRRRRRGRRGGRRMREEGEGGAPASGSEPYAWSEAAPTTAPDGDVYAWNDPAAPRSNRRPDRAPRPVEAEPAFAAATDSEIGVLAPEPGPQVEAAAGETPYAWDTPEALGIEPASPVVEASVEPEAAPRKPKRVRAPRKPKALSSTAAAETPLVLSEPEPAAPVAQPEPEPALVAEPEPAPVSAPEPVAAPAAPDPAEIVAPPAVPKRGWWRR